MSYTKDMRRDRIKKTITYLSLLFWLCLLVACGQQEETTDDGVTYFHHSIADRNTQETQENSTETEKSEEFLLTAVDQIQESLQLYRYADGMEYRYYYGTGTRFYDKYGNRTPVTSFEPGLLVTPIFLFFFLQTFPIATMLTSFFLFRKQIISHHHFSV